MPTSLFAQQTMPSHNSEEDSLFFEDSISPSNALFPSELLDPSSLLHIPSTTNGGPSSMNRPSPASDNSLSPLAYQQSFGMSSGSSSSRVPSLSPSTQSINLSNMGSISMNGQSPRSSSSPSSHSNFSLSATDDFLFNNNNSFDSTELDVLFQSEDSKILLNGSGEDQTLNQFVNIPNNGSQGQDKSNGQSLFFPDQQSNPFLTHNNDGNLDFLQNLLFSGNGNTNTLNGMGNDDTFDMLNLDSPISTGKKSSQSGFPIDFDFAQQAKAIGNMTHSQQQTLQPQYMKDQIKQEGWPIGHLNGFENQLQVNNDQMGNLGYGININGSSLDQPSTDASTSNVKQPRQTKASQQLRQSNKTPAAPKESSDPPVVGKHNKTERRYRQKVQAAQADLRDAIPALRVLYATSTEEQKRTTDFRAADGTVDGLGEVTRPNASAKATILIGAKKYIELLQRRSAMLQRKVQELEAFRLAVAGEDNLKLWQADFGARESLIQAAAEAAAMKAEEDSLDEDDEVDEEEEEQQTKRKRTKTATAPKQPRAKPGPKKKDQNSTTTMAQNAASGGLRMFAAFAVSFSFLPSASNVLKQTSAQSSANAMPSGVIGQATTGQILSKLPLITAEHTSRLLARGLPGPIAPAPHTLIDWTWRLLVAVILAASMGPIISHWTKSEEKKKAGNVSLFAKDCARLIVPVGKKFKASDDQDYWNQKAANIIGGVITPSTLEKWHVVVHLHNTGSDVYSLTLLALLQHDIPFLRSSTQIWRNAQSRITTSTPLPLATVLKLPLLEALRCAESLDKTSSPITAIAEEITLVHVYDLYSRFFIKLVDASTRSKTAGNTTASLKTLLYNLESYDIGQSLKLSAFDKEVRTTIEGLPKGSAAHALGLVLIGLWGIFVKPTPSAQVALATALAAEEVQGAGKGLTSISAMLELLYPGSKDVLAIHGVDKSLQENRLSKNALGVDKLALTCIEYIKLLISSNEVNDRTVNESRLKRLENSRNIQKASSHLRLVLTQIRFIGFAFEDSSSLHPDDEVDDEEGEEDGEVLDEKDVHQDLGLENEVRRFELAKENLVRVLCDVSRRAAGRASGRDDDSGLEGDLDDL
ncbi:hypothetical protein V865_005485 [Kwoniella europaea PYCC6329]|uniref:BHLH domain-containing protein n=1 Tax=Kwoniella europaea PYCC6329 TaxID=1423913 RepID=A0AAX4KNK5_9TREE